MNEKQTYSKDVVVELKNGLHLSPSVQIVQTAQGFRAKLAIHKGDRVVDGKSMLDLMTLAAEHGTRLRLEATGDDAQAALDAIGALFDRNFVIDGVSADRVLVD